jgi:hypothetical protein
MKLTILVSTWMLASSLAVAQGEGTELHRHNLVVGLGPAMPLGNATSYLSTAPFVRFAYGYRFNRLFQADAGFQMAFGAANNQNAVITDFGTVQGGDHELMIPLGGRTYIPLPFRRIQVSAGGGAHICTTLSRFRLAVATIPPVATVARRAVAGAATVWPTSVISSMPVTISGSGQPSSTSQVRLTGCRRQLSCDENDRPLAESGIRVWLQLLMDAGVAPPSAYCV